MKSLLVGTPVAHFIVCAHHLQRIHITFAACHPVSIKIKAKAPV